MSKYTHILYVLCGLALAGCTAQPVPEESKIPVLFTVGSEDLELTKAGVPYMPGFTHTSALSATAKISSSENFSSRVVSLAHR